jgi:predicted aspartyl protease
VFEEVKMSGELRNLPRSQIPVWERRNTRSLCGILLMALSLLFFSEKGDCEFYKYRDKEGIIHFADDLSNIPQEYHDQLNVISEPSDYLSEEEKALILEDEEKAEAQRNLSEADRENKDTLAGEETKVVIMGNMVIVPVKLSYRLFDTEAMLVLDTGATTTVLHQEIAHRLHVVGFDDIGQAHIAGGTTITTRKLTLNSVKLGPVEKKGLDVQFIEYKGVSVPYQGLLGMNFLRGLNYTINFDKQVIEWK